MNNKIKVLVVDDSGFARVSVSKALTSDPGIEVVGFARDGIEALDLTKSLRPDVVTLDVTMPRMDGLTALGHIMTECPTPVVMVSALTGEQTRATIEALELGAIDFFLKSSSTTPAGPDNGTGELRGKVRLASKARVLKLRRNVAPSKMRPPAASRITRRPTEVDRLVVIGSSTGGPRALADLIPLVPADIPAAIVIVQHMPEGFTKSLSERLDQMSQISVKEAQTGDKLKAGQALLAPGDYHMTISQKGAIRLNRGPTVWGVRPAVDVTMESVARVYGSSVLGVVLTGMGSDGTKGASMIRGAGGEVVVQNEATCAVYGMPKSVVDSGNADRIVPLSKMVNEIVRMASR